MSNSLIYFSPAIFKDKKIEIPGLNNFLELQKLFSIHVSINDRTESIISPFKQKILNPLPEFDNHFNLSFTECSMLRIAELEKIHNETGKTFRLFYSGGIDSTGILATFITYFGAEKTSKILEICCSKESIYENPWVWDRYISKNNFKLSCSHQHTDLWGDDNLITLMGEGNDQLSIMTSFSYHWPKFIGHDKQFCDVDRSLLRKYISYQYKINNEIAMEQIFKIIDLAPFNLKNMYQILWWLNISLSWESIMLRALGATTKKNFPKDYFNKGLPQFYNTSEFQKWSYNYIKDFTEDVILDYKNPTKDMIVNLLNFQEYKNKGKFMSWPRLQSMIPYALMIDDEFNVYRNIEDFLKFVEPNNSFI